jgi:hypothetical protein
MGAGAQLAGLRKDGTTFPVRVSLTPVTTTSGQLTLAVIRDITETGRLDDLATLARGAGPAQQEHVRLLDAVINGLFHAGLSLQAAAGPPADAARLHIEAVLGELDGIIRQIRGAAFNERTRPGPARPMRPAMTGDASRHSRRGPGRGSACRPALGRTRSGCHRASGPGTVPSSVLTPCR